MKIRGPFSFLVFGLFCAFLHAEDEAAATSLPERMSPEEPPKFEVRNTDPEILTPGVTRARIQRRVEVKTVSPEVAPEPKAPVQTKSPTVEKPVAKIPVPEKKILERKTSPAQNVTAIPSRKAVVRRPSRTIRVVKEDKLSYLNLRDLAAYYGMKFVYTKTGAVLLDKDRKMEFTEKRREGTINGIKVFFLYPMLIRNGVAYVSEPDFRKVINPVFQAQSLKKHRIKTIMLDPGHGGTDPGAAGPVFAEKNINLQIALKLKRALELVGFRILMTRSGDTFPTLPQRSELCEKKKPDLYISIHCNSTTSKLINGVEVFSVTPDGCASTSDNKPVNVRKSGNAFDDNSYRLAYDVQSALVRMTGMEDRGVRHARFFVIANASCPAILVECGYLSHPREGRQLAKREVQEKIVTSILLGLANYATAMR